MTYHSVEGFRLSPQQKNLWLLRHAADQYCAQCVVALTGQLRVALLEEAVQRVVERHEILRTTFQQLPGMPIPIQVIGQTSQPSWTLLDLHDQDAPAQAATLARVVADDRAQPFDLEHGPLVRLTLLTLSEQDHRLVICLPALCADQIALANLVAEISQAYAACLSGLPAATDAEDVLQYLQFSEWQHELLESQDADRPSQGWGQGQPPAPDELVLPFARIPAARGAFRPEGVSRTLDPELAQQIEALSQRSGATTAELLLACWQTVLWRLSDQPTVTVSCAFDGRKYDELTGALGLFAQWLPIRSQVQADSRLSDLLSQVTEAVEDAASTQEYFGGHQTAGPADPAQEPRPQTICFEFQEWPAKHTAGDLHVAIIEQYTCINRFHLRLACIRQCGSYRAELHYDPAVIPAGHVALLADYFETLLRAAVEQPDARVADLPLLSAAARRQLLVDFNATSAERPQAQGIHRLFEAQVARTPEAVAARFGDQQLTYAALNASANRLARHLRALGVDAGALVGLCVERSLDMVVGVLGILKAGAAYVPLDPHYPAERLGFVLRDTQVALVVTQERLAELLREHGVALVCLDRDGEALRDQPADNPSWTTAGAQPAYVIYTSGSTGRAKGVIINHANLCHYVHSLPGAIGVTADDRYLHTASISFSSSVRQLLVPLICGATSVIASSDQTRDPLALFALIKQQQVTVWDVVPTFWRNSTYALQTLDPAARAELLHSELRLILSASEGLLWDIPRIWTHDFGYCGRIVNMYGQTETTGIVTVYPFPAQPDEHGQYVPVGRPIANTTAYLLDAALQPVPLGVPGDLYIGGLSLGQGYLGQPGLTAERFVPDPFARSAGARLYRTGDRACYRLDGTIALLGRADHQAKIRGFRVELGEIETTLVQHPAVRHVAVVVREDTPDNRELVAYVVPMSQAAAPDTAELRSYLKAKLPEYMVPATFVLLDALPLTPTGKLDRTALASLEPTQLATAEVIVAPRTPVEALMASIWADVLGRERVSIDGNFFDLGGHSLLGTQLIARVNTAFEIELPLRSLFEASTVAELAALVEQKQREGAGRAMPPLVALDRAQYQASDRPSPTIDLPAQAIVFPTSFAQQRLWFLNQLEPESGAYTVAGAMRIDGPLDPELLATCLGTIVERHETLRTTFAEVDGQPVQIVMPAQPLRLQHLDLEGAAEQAQALEHAIREQVRQPFDLERGPLLRAVLIRLAPEQHVALLTMHHIVCDGWSIGVLIRELVALYAAAVTGAAAELAPLAVQYGDYGVWQRAWLAQIRERQLAAWQAQLADVPTVLALPTDFPRPAVPSFHGATHTVTLSPALTAQLEALSQREGATLFMTVLAAFQLLLQRWSGQPRFLVGSPVAHRTPPAVEPLIGFFANTLVLRADLRGQPTFRELLQRVRETALDAYALQDLPFEQLVEALQPERDLSRHPLFQVSFALQTAPLPPLALPQLTVAPLALPATTAKFDLSLVLSPAAGGLTGGFEYATDLFEAATIARLAGHFTTLLEALVAAPAQPVGRLPLLTAAEQQQLAAWNATELPPAPACLHALIAAQAQRTPAAVALVAPDATLPYATLLAQATQLAWMLRQQGVGPEARVAIALERSSRLVVALLGTWLAGGVTVPLDPRSPRERLALILRDAAPEVVLSETALVDRLPAGLETTVLCLDTAAVADALAQQPTTAPAAGVTPQHAAYVIYTSGSTGTPKGVVVEHQQVVAVLRASQQQLGLRAGDVLPWIATAAFDIALFELCHPLLVGGTTRLLTTAEVLDLPGLLRTLETCTVLHAVPSLLQQIVATAQATGGEVARYDGLRRVCVGGDAVPAALLAAMAQVFRRAAVTVLYGPTEATIICTTHEVRGAVVGQPIGRALPWMQVRVCDALGQEVPVGVVGELCIGGAGVARGYLQQAALTAAKFVPDGWSGVAGARLYRTGDLARRQADGTLVFVGRGDQQVKVRGYRIELGEVEAALGQQEAVAAGVVAARPLADGALGLVAYVVPRAGARLTLSGLRTALSGRLPEYMLPSALVELEALPLTAQGKVDRRALPAPEGGRPAETAYMAARTAREAQLAAVWAAVLGVAQVGVEDNFFALGGHSLLATQVVGRLREQGVGLTLRQLFEQPTVAGLAATLDGATQDELAAPPLVPVARDLPLPLSFAQQRLWLVDQLQPGSAAYNMSIAMRLLGSLDVAALEVSLSTIVARHEALRTTIGLVDGQPVQIIAPAQPLALPLVDLSQLPADQREAAARRLALEEAQRPFDLQAGPLLRTTLLRLSPSEHLWLLTMHHIVCDGWSIGVLIRELAALYEAAVTGTAATLPTLAVQYGDYAVWQRAWLAQIRERQLAAWQAQLADVPTVLALPTDFPRPAMPSFRGATHTVTLSPALTAELQTLSQREGATLFMTLLAAFQVLLARTSGQPRFLVGSPVAHRTPSAVEPLIGFFANTLVLRADLRGAPSFTELLRRVRETALEAYAHQDLPFEQLVEALQPERDLSRHPLFQVMFALQNAPLEPLALPDLTLTPLEPGTGTSKFDLTLSMMETESGLVGTWSYSTDLFEAATIARLAGHFETLLAALVADPAQAVARLPLLTTAEQQQLAAWNATGAPLPDVCLHELIAAQAARTPEAIAVVAPDGRLSYRALEERATQLAWALRQRGVGPGALVAVCAERSVELIVGLLGILKAGGAYVPLDPAYPTTRLADMLADAAPAVVLTQAALVDRLPASTAPLLCLDNDAALLAQQPTTPLACAVDPEHPAYVIYTSGSTGRPKGAINTHRGIVNRLLWMQASYRLDESDRVLQKTPYSFDVSVWELFWPLLTGARLVFARPDGHRDSAYLVDLIVEQQITTLHFVPSMLQVFLEESDLERCRSLRRVFCSGEALPVALQERFFTRLGAELHNLYGPTEAAVDVSFWACVSDKSATTVPIGRPVANTQLHILDSAMQPVPAGVAGELYIGGVQLALGYLNRPALTAEKFVPDPFAEGPAARLYRTGDLARYRPDGAIEFLGRIDHQVKVRGLRIELGEIEAVLGQHPAVREVVVVARELPGGGAAADKRLVAYVVGEPRTENHAPAGAEPGSDGSGLGSASATELRSFLQTRLPDYMVPAIFMVLDSLPLLPNGKVDRKALPEPDQSRPSLDQAFVAPRTPAEEQLARIWEDVLRLSDIGVHDNFFELGGDSILSIQIVNRATQAGLWLTPRQLFQHQTIAELAAVAGAAPVVQAEQGLVSGPALLTPIQHWFAEQQFANPHHWNQALLLDLREPLDPALLEQAARQIVRHHDALRLRLVHTAAGWQLSHASPDELAIVTYADLAGMAPARQRAALESIGAELHGSLHLADGPLMRIALLDHGPDATSRLLIVIHHLAIDAVSWQIVLEDLQTAYTQLSRGAEVRLPRKTSSFKQWAERLAAYAQSAALERERDYWLAAARRTVAPLPLDGPGGDNTHASAQVISLRLSADETSALLQEVRDAYHTQINDLLLTALAETLSQWTGASAVLVDLEGHGREEILDGLNVSRTVGWFTTLFPMLLDLRDADTPRAALAAISAQLDQLPQHGIGYGLLRYLSPDAETVARLRAQPQAEVLFNYLGQLDRRRDAAALWELSSESGGAAQAPDNRRSYLLEITARISAGQLVIDWVYSKHLHRHATIAALAQSFREALVALVAQAQSPEAGAYDPADFPLADLDEQTLSLLIDKMG